MEHKTCTKCGESKPIDDFRSFTRNGKTYKEGRCKACNLLRKRVVNPKTRKLFYDGTSKECGVCGIIKPVSDFIAKGRQFSNKCQMCRSEYNKEWYSKNAEHQRIKNSLRKKRIGKLGLRLLKYHLSEENYTDMLAKHGGKCWICRQEEATCIDHDHACCNRTGGCGECIRGLLCASCNSMLGCAGDLSKTFTDGVEYLENWKSGREDLTDS